MSRSVIDVQPPPVVGGMQRWLPRWSRRDRRYTVFVDAAGHWIYAANEDVPQRAGLWADWCGKQGGAQVDVVLSGALTHQFVTDDATLPLVDDGDVGAWARQQFAYYHGSAAGVWPIATWADGFRYVACAAHGIDLAAMQATAAAGDIRIRRVQPWWALALRAAVRREPDWVLRDRQVLILADGPLATVVQCERARPAAVVQRRLAQAHVDELLPMLHDAAAWHGDGAAATLLVACRLGGSEERLAAHGRFRAACGLAHPPRQWVAP